MDLAKSGKHKGVADYLENAGNPARAIALFMKFEDASSFLILLMKRVASVLCSSS